MVSLKFRAVPKLWLLCFSFASLVFLGLIACTQEPQKREKILDMTYPFDENSIYWPTAKPFELTKVFWGRTDAGYWYASNEFSASEHGGTHADAPIHFAEGGRTIDEIPLEEWMVQQLKSMSPPNAWLIEIIFFRSETFLIGKGEMAELNQNLG